MKLIRILSLGNNSSQLAQSYLPKLAKSDSAVIVAGALYTADVNLSDIVKSAEENSEVFTFVCNSEDSVRFDVSENFSVSRALDWLDWDYVVIQQSDELSSDENTYFPYLTKLCEIIKANCRKATVIIAEPLLAESKSACEYAVKNSDAVMCLPVGEVFASAEKAGLCKRGDADSQFGRISEFISACVWYEMITGNNVSLNKYRLPFVESRITAEIKNLVHNSLSNA